MDRKELQLLLCKAEQRIERERPKRAVKAILFFSAVFFILFLWFFKPHGIEILEYILLSLCCGLAHLLVSTPVYHWLFSTAQAEDNYVNEIKKKLNQ